MKRFGLLYFLLFYLPLVLPGSMIAQNSISFNHSNSFIQLSDHPELHLDRFTLECWIMINPGGNAVTTSDNSSVYPLIIRGNHDIAEIDGINFLLGIRERDQVLHFEFESLTTGDPRFKTHSLSGFTSLKNNNWYHIAAVYDGKEMRLYLNGKLEASLETFQPPYNNSTGVLSIGSSFNMEGSQNGVLSGKIDALRIWKVGCTQDDILMNMNSDSVIASANLVASIPFNNQDDNLLDIQGLLEDIDYTLNNTTRAAGSHFKSLVPSQIKSTLLLSAGLISDPQYCDCDPPGWSDRIYRETLNKLPVAIDTINNRDVDFSITLGDVIDTVFSSYDSILPLYEDLDTDHYFLLGNHEYAINDIYKPQVVELLKMPGYYYAIDHMGWKFLLLDGTELASYTQSLHPELKAESDSLRASVHGEISDKYWNGGISRTQQAWMEQQIKLAADNQQHIIIFCHFTLLPDSSHLNLWNKDEIIDLINKFDNVVAYINGHDHYGGYEFRNNKHYYTNYGMVETYDSNSFSILKISQNYIEFDGFGYNPDRTLRYKNVYSELAPPQVESSILHYYHDSADFVTKINIPGKSSAEINFGLVGQAADNELFTLRNDSLFLNAMPNYLDQKQFNIKIAGITPDFDSISSPVSFQLDTLVAVRRINLSDTTLAVNATLSFSTNDLFEDYSRNGLSHILSVNDTSIVNYHYQQNNVVLIPKKYGSTAVELVSSDSYTGRVFKDSFTISVVDPENIAPSARPSETIAAHYEDTVLLNLDTLFTDQNSDLLYFTVSMESGNSFLYLPDSDNLLKLWVDSAGIFDILILADDQRGGTDSLRLTIKFNTPPSILTPADPITLIVDQPGIDIWLDSLYFDKDSDMLSYEINEFNSDIISAHLSGDNQLFVAPVSPGSSQIALLVRDDFKGKLYDTLYVTILANSVSLPRANRLDKLIVYPNPVDHSLFITANAVKFRNLDIRIYNSLGEMVMPLLSNYTITENKIITIPIDELDTGIYFIEISTNNGIQSIQQFSISR